MNEQEVNAINEKFEKSHPQEILEWAIRTFHPRIGLSSSFGAESVGLLHMVTQIEPSIPVLFINTGHLFRETIEFSVELKKRFNLNLKEFKASPDQITSIQKKLTDPQNKNGACCDDIKVELMQKSLEGLDCWIAGVRRSQSSTRKDIKIVESYRSGLVKVHPLANWTPKDLYDYMTKKNLPFHPLWAKGYKSIGCEPCTQLPLPGQDERSGRWTGTDKTECGIHTFLPKQ